MTLQELLAQYDRRRGTAEKRLAEQEQALYSAHPALLAMQERRQELILGQLLAVMKNPQEKQAALEDFARRMVYLRARHRTAPLGRAVPALPGYRLSPAGKPQKILPLPAGTAV